MSTTDKTEPHVPQWVERDRKWWAEEAQRLLALDRANCRGPRNRHYCPICGEVRGAGYDHDAGLFIPQHWRITAESYPRGVWCKGGAVTEKDKAP